MPIGGTLGDMTRAESPGRTDTASTEIRAAPGAIYEAFANPRQLIRWLPPGSMTGRALEYDFREGGRYRIALTYDEASPDGVGKSTSRTDVSAGRFVELVPGQRIVQVGCFESSDAAFAGEMRMTWSIEAVGDGTRVTVTAENVPEGVSEADHQEGLRASLANLAALVTGPGG